MATPEECLIVEVGSIPVAVASSVKRRPSYAPELLDVESEQNDVSLAQDALAPEQELTVVALRLAVLEKAASGLGVLAFVWATVVLLGGFVGNISTFDFWVVSGLLLTEGTRVFGRSHELEWQHAAARSVKVKSTRASFYAKSSSVLRSAMSILVMIHKPLDADAGSAFHEAASPTPAPYSKRTAAALKHDFHIRRTWSWSSVPFIPYSQFFSARHISFMLHLLQLGSAFLTVVFSLARLIQRNYSIDSHSQDTNNLAAGLSIFYTLSLLEAAIFLIERVYWEYCINWKKLLLQVAVKANLGEHLLVTIRQFFYDVYSQCLKGSIFDGLELDLVTYSINKIQANNGKEQLGGALMLATFIMQNSFLDDTLRKLGTTPGVTERLLEMITWRNEHENEIRRAAAKILCQLVVHNNNSFRVLATAGALEGIVSLLVEKKGKFDRDATTGELLDNELKLHGLRILKSLAKDDKNCVQIGSTRGILELLVANIEVRSMAEVDKVDQINQIKIFKKSLQVLGRLASAKGEHGKVLRQEIVKVVFTLRNLRDVIQYGECHPKFREIAVDIIASLALDDTIKEAVAATGGILQNLLTLFFLEVTDKSSVEFKVRLKAGKALQLLILKSRPNSSRMCSRSDGSTVEKFVNMLQHSQPMISACAASVLGSICAYLGRDKTGHILAAMPWIINSLKRVRGKQLEAVVGLAASAIPLLSTEEFDQLLASNEEKLELVSKLMTLASQPPPSLLLPMMRRHAVELVTILMQRDHFFWTEFNSQKFVPQLQQMLDTISDVENFITFSGTLGITRHDQSMERLIELAIQQAKEDQSSECLY